MTRSSQPTYCPISCASPYWISIMVFNFGHFHVTNSILFLKLLVKVLLINIKMLYINFHTVIRKRYVWMPCQYWVADRFKTDLVICQRYKIGDEYSHSDCCTRSGNVAIWMERKYCHVGFTKFLQILNQHWLKFFHPLFQSCQKSFWSKIAMKF